MDRFVGGGKAAEKKSSGFKVQRRGRSMGVCAGIIFFFCRAGGWAGLGLGFWGAESQKQIVADRRDRGALLGPGLGRKAVVVTFFCVSGGFFRRQMPVLCPLLACGPGPGQGRATLR